MLKETFTRKELYQLVWSHSLSALARKYKISDNGLRKLCKKINIPLPRQGHWQQVKSGKSVKTISLPTKYISPNQVTLYLREESQTPIKYNEAIAVKKLAARLGVSQKFPLLVPTRLTDPADLVIATRKNIQPSFGYPYYFISHVLDLKVGKACLPRALRLYDALIKLIRARDHEVSTKMNNTFVRVNAEEIQIRIKEKLKINPEKGKGNYYLLSGKLMVFLQGIRQEKSFVDGAQPLEDQLLLIMAQLEVMAAGDKKERLRREKYRNEQQEAQKRLKAAQERKEKEENRFHQLLEEVNRHQQARQIREYLHKKEQKAIQEGRLINEMKQWLTWAREKADELDPLVEG